MANTRKIQVLGDAVRVFNKYDEYRRPVHEFGYSDYAKGDVVEVPEWVAERLLKIGIQAPNGAYRPVVMPAGDDEDDHVVKGLRDDVSPTPEVDFGTSDVAGNLIADPKGDLAEQRQAARKAEATPQARPQGRPAPDKR